MSPYFLLLLFCPYWAAAAEWLTIEEELLLRDEGDGEAGESDPLATPLGSSLESFNLLDASVGGH